MHIKQNLVCFCCLLLACCLGLSGLFRALSTRESETTDIEPARVIIIDPGHGGEDGGAVGTTGVYEKDLNLQISRTLADLFRAEGYTVIETRTDDRLLYGEADKDGHKKRGDLAARLAIMQENPEALFISIHMNTYPTEACRGLQVWYSENDPRSLPLARAVQETVKETLQPENHRKVKAANSLIYLLHKAPTPAILVECGFLSTPAECEQLSVEAYQRALALAIFVAISENF